MRIKRESAKIILMVILIITIMGCSSTFSGSDSISSTTTRTEPIMTSFPISTEWVEEKIPEPTKKAPTTQIVIPAPTQTESGGEMNSQATLPTSPGIQKLVDLALADLAQRLSIDLEDIIVLEVREVVWPDASLGCPQPDMSYKQVPYDGLLIRLSVAGKQYSYHSGGSRDSFLCEQSLKLSKTPGVLESLIPPPGNADK